MSKKSQIIEVSPPQHAKMEEKIASSGHDCPDCQGTGLVTVYDEGYRTDQKAKCPRCQGEGRLRAQIAIIWEADITL